MQKHTLLQEKFQRSRTEHQQKLNRLEVSICVTVNEFVNDKYRCSRNSIVFPRIEFESANARLPPRCDDRYGEGCRIGVRGASMLNRIAQIIYPCRHIPNKNDSLEERLTASAKLNRESASTSQGTARMFSDLKRRLADAEAQGATARRAQVAAEKQVLRLQADLHTAHEQELQSKQTQSALQDKLRRQQHRLDALNNEKQRGEKRDADSSAVKQNLDQAVFAKLQSTLLVRGYIGEQIPLRAQLQPLFRNLQNVKKGLIRCKKTIAMLWLACFKIET